MVPDAEPFDLERDIVSPLLEGVIRAFGDSDVASVCRSRGLVTLQPLEEVDASPDKVSEAPTGVS